MAGISWLETDNLSNQDISSALAVGAYIADADRAVMVQCFVDQAAGNGDYVMYATLRINGAGSSYIILPKTTMTAASGETAIAGQSGWINVRSGDVVTVYVDGLAGDTTTPDTIVRWFELSGLTAAEVNAEVVDALNVDTYAEPGQGAPAATASLAAKIGYLYKAWRNKKTQTATTLSIFNDAGDTVDQKATVSDDGSTFSKGEIGSGP